MKVSFNLQRMPLCGFVGYLRVMVSFFFAQDLSKLGRDITQCVIVDNSPQSYIFHPDNAVSLQN